MAAKAGPRPRAPEVLAPVLRRQDAWQRRNITSRNQLPQVSFFVTCERRGLLAGYHVRYQLLSLSFRGWGVLALAGLKLCKIRLLPSKAFFDLAMACPLDRRPVGSPVGPTASVRNEAWCPKSLSSSDLDARKQILAASHTVNAGLERSVPSHPP